MAEEKRKLVRRKEVVVSIPVIKAPRPLQGFVDFVREQGVVGLAVGLVLGVAGKGVVDSLVNNVFNPIIGLFGESGGELGARYVCLKSIAGECTNKLGYGRLISDILSFLIVALSVYLVVHMLKLDKLDKKKDK
jgi:large conductance mechanosensitive channel protein